MTIYTEDEMLMLSGIQHYVFCPRQWAMIHIEQQWEENRLTTEGMLLHQHVDDPMYRQKNRNIITLRRVAIASKVLGLNGFSDAIELLPADNYIQNSIRHPKYQGNWSPVPIEYKRGKEKPDRRDEVQVAAQALCLEEMYNIHIPNGALYYGEEHARKMVVLNEELRTFTQYCANQMHKIYQTGITPKAEYKSHCRSCSIKDICMPKLPSRCLVKNYLKTNLYEETT